MPDYRIFLGYVSILITFASYGVYFRQIIFGKVRPHAFSWLVWSLATGIVFAAQVVKHGGAGAWATGMTSLACIAVFFLALVKGERKFRKTDWIFLGSALLALLLWWLTQEPTLSVVLLTITDVLGSAPTIYKSYRQPYQESLTLFALSSIKFTIALFALESISLATGLYPASLVLANAVIVLVILARRKV